MNKIDTTCIIDDDPIFVYGTKRVMKEVDFTEKIVVYNNGQDAIDGLTETVNNGDNIPPVVFLDLNMPIMNGWEFLEEFNKLPEEAIAGVTIYIVSSSIDPRDLEKVKQFNVVNNYIVKPVTPKDLEAIMQTIKDHKAQ